MSAMRKPAVKRVVDPVRNELMGAFTICGTTIHFQKDDVDVCAVIVCKGGVKLGYVFRHPCGEVVWQAKGREALKYSTLCRVIMPVMQDFDVTLMILEARQRGWSGTVKALNANGGQAG